MVVEHFFTGVRDEDPGWRWHCSCGAAGNINCQSRSSSAWAWYPHAFKATGAKVPKSRQYLPWMRQATERDHGLRMADLLVAWLDLGLTPDARQYPWGPHPLEAGATS